VSPRLSRFALPAALIAGALFTATSAAWANNTISINSGNVPAYAATYKPDQQNCDPKLGGGPYSDKDVWVFILPGPQSTSGDFVSVTLHFDTNADNIADTTLVIDTDGGGFVNGGPEASKAFIAVTAGYQLIDATAVITGTADQFTLSHTCPANGQTPSPSPSASATTPGDGGSPSTSGSVPNETTPGEPTTPVTTTTPGLPVTGTAVGGIVLAGTAMVAVGIALLVARRRRDAAALAGDAGTINDTTTDQLP
jgi:LPXTG-motif cell wall-anchored protein